MAVLIATPAACVATSVMATLRQLLVIGKLSWVRVCRAAADIRHHGTLTESEDSEEVGEMRTDGPVLHQCVVELINHVCWIGEEPS